MSSLLLFHIPYFSPTIIDIFLKLYTTTPTAPPVKPPATLPATALRAVPIPHAAPAAAVVTAPV